MKTEGSKIPSRPGAFGDKSRPGKAQAEEIAIQALGWLASDMERLERFLSLSGLSPDNLRAAASQPGFLAAVLDHLSQDESLLLAFAENAALSPESVARAQQHLSPHEQI